MPNNITVITYINNIDLSHMAYVNNITAVTYSNNIDLSHMAYAK